MPDPMTLDDLLREARNADATREYMQATTWPAILVLADLGCHGSLRSLGVPTRRGDMPPRPSVLAALQGFAS